MLEESKPDWVFPPLSELDCKDLWCNAVPCEAELESPEEPAALECGCAEVIENSLLVEALLLSELGLLLVLFGDDELVDFTEVLEVDGDSDEVGPLDSFDGDELSPFESGVLEALDLVDRIAFVLEVLDVSICASLLPEGLFCELV